KIEGTSEKTETVEQAFPESLQNAKVNLTDVSFSYEAGAKKAIDQLNLTILPGEKLGVLGKSGTGKSTLLKLIAGVLEPDHGEVKVNEIDMKDDYLAEAVSVLNQKPHLFNTSILNNIKIARPEATKKKVNDVIKQTQLNELINQFANGLNTNVEEMENRLSVDKKQRSK